MTSAASVLVCALSLLGRSEATLPRIELIDTPPAYVSANAEAWVNHQTQTIYLITSAPSFRAVRRATSLCGQTRDLRKVASIIAHEEWHIRHGRDEEGAYLAQISTLLRLGDEIESPNVFSVRKSMRAVLDAQRRVLSARR